MKKYYEAIEGSGGGIDWEKEYHKLSFELLEKNDEIEGLKYENLKYREFVSNVAKGQQGELKGVFIVRIMSEANKLNSEQNVQVSDTTGLNQGTKAK